MKRILSFVCALVLLFTCFPCVAVSADAIKENSKTADDSIVVLEMEDPELFPDLRPDDSKPMALLAPMEDDLPDRLMDYLVEHFAACETSIDVEEFNIPYAQWEELRSVLWYETPELFHLYGLGCSYDSGTGAIVTIGVDYRSFADTAAEYHDCLEKMLDGAAYLLQGVKDNDELTDVEKALLLHDRLAVWTEYDLGNVNTANGSHKIFTAYSALGEGLSVCQGYAMAYMYLLEQVGIESDYCSSDALWHGWNIVYIDGVAYHVDVTWDDPTNSSSATYYDDYGRVYHNNFLLSTDGIRASGHTASDYNTAPKDNRYDGDSDATWWKASSTAIQLIDDNIYYLDENNRNVICADNRNVVYTADTYSANSKLSGTEEELLFSAHDNILAIDPETGVASVIYTSENGFIEGMKYEKGKLHIQFKNGDGSSRRESVNYAELGPEEDDVANKCGDNLTWTLDDQGTLTISGTGDMYIFSSNYYNPDSWSSAPWAPQINTIKRVIIEEGVTSIADAVFSGCKNLLSVSIPEGVTQIGYAAFDRCSSLKSVKIPDSVNSLGAYAFWECKSLSSVSIGKGIEILSTGVFQYCGSLKTVNIPENVTKIGFQAFLNTGLISVTMDDGVTTIDNSAFEGCKNLNSVIFGDSLESIGDKAFLYCERLTSVSLPDSLISIGVQAFEECGQLSEVALGNRLESIGESAFDGCFRLKTVLLPDSLVTIGKRAFASCQGMESVNIPRNVTTIGEGAFGYLNKVTGFWVDENNAYYSSDAKGVLFNKEKTLLIQAPSKLSGSYKIPSGVTHIENGAFVFCNLTSVVIPGSIATIGESLFGSCSALSAVTIENGVRTIGRNAFRGCDALVSVKLPDSVTTIEDFAFSQCTKLKSVNIPDDVTVIGTDAFELCESLRTITIGSGVTTIGVSAFINCTNLTSVVISAGVETIESYAFYGCNNLSDVYYRGSKDAWSTIVIGENNSNFTNARLHFESGLKITTQPKSAKSASGQVAKVTVKASGDGLTYTWYHKSATATKYSKSSVTGATYSVKMSSSVDGRYVYCVVSDIYGNSIKTDVVRIYQIAYAKITTQPVNVAVASGKTAKVTVKATGDGLKYTWYYAKKGSSKFTKTAVTSASYSVKMSSSVDGRKVYCVVTDKYGTKVQTKTVTLYKGTPVKITTQPKGLTVVKGSNIGKLEIKASGTGLKYQWYAKCKGESAFTKLGSSVKTYSFALQSVMASKLNGAQAYCVVTDKYGVSVKSSVVTIKVPAQPKITGQPKSVTQVSGKTVKFSVKASGEGLKYQWYYAKKGSNSFRKLSGATKATYSVKVSSSVNGRKYYCKVTDKYGRILWSSTVTLTMKTIAKITTQPKSVTVKSGKTAKVTIKAVGDGLKYTWYYLKTGATKYTKASATGASYSVKMAAAWKNAKVYCVISDKYGNTVQSKTATLKMK